MTEPLNIKAIEEELKVISPWPWDVYNSFGDYSITDKEGDNIACCSHCYPECCIGIDEEDAKFVSKSPERISALIEEVQRLKRAFKNFIDSVDEATNHPISGKAFNIQAAQEALEEK